MWIKCESIGSIFGLSEAVGEIPSLLDVLEICSCHGLAEGSTAD